MLKPTRITSTTIQRDSRGGVELMQVLGIFFKSTAISFFLYEKTMGS